MAPVIKRASATRITRFRPQESATTEAKGEMMRAKSEVQDVTIDLSSEESDLPDSEVPMDTRVAEITPVSSVGCSSVSVLFFSQTPYLR